MRVKQQSPTEEMYAELQKVYDIYNEKLFDNQLPGALIVMTRRTKSYGYFSPKRFSDANGRETDEIALNQSYFAVRSVEQVLSTMCHELCHAWQYHFGKVSKRCYHNKEFADKMEEIGLITSHTGYPGGRRVGEQMTHYIAEDGKFIQVTRELLKESLGIVWFDRYPEPNIMQEPSPDDVIIAVEKRKTEDELKQAKGSKHKGGRKRSPVNLTAPAKLTPPAISTEPSLAASIGGVVNTVSREDIENQRLSRKTSAVLLVEPTPASGKRVKYGCPSCMDNVWGKVGLNLLCGRDGCEHAKLLPLGR